MKTSSVKRQTRGRSGRPGSMPVGMINGRLSLSGIAFRTGDLKARDAFDIGS